MRNSISQRWVRRLSIALLLFPIGSAFSLSAQTSGRAGTPPINPSGPFADSIERRNRETALRILKVENAGRDLSGSISPAVLERFNNDLKRIQIVRMGLVRDIKDAKLFEYDRLIRDTAEIRSRAGRIRAFFADAEKQTDDKPGVRMAEYDETTIQEAVFNLCLEISRFIENPIFRSKPAYTARDAAEAAKTLDAVIELSSNIKNSAEALQKGK